MPKPLPKPLIARLTAILSEADLAQTLAAFATERSSAFRLNTIKSSPEEAEAALEAKCVRFEKVPGIPHAYLVPKADEYGMKGTDLFYGGKIYVQGLSSQIPAHFLDLKPGIRVLDACAAPGSKTTQIAALMLNQGEIVALENHQVRFEKLAYNCKLQGATNVTSQSSSPCPL